MKVPKCIMGKGRGLNSFKSKRWAAKDAKSDPKQKMFRKLRNRRIRKANKIFNV